MSSLIAALVLLVLALICSILNKTYFSAPIYELKRLAADKEEYRKIYQVASYATSARFILWFILCLSLAGSIIISVNSLPITINILVISLALYLIFNFIPFVKSTKIESYITKLFTPIFLRVLEILHPLINGSKQKININVKGKKHTGLYEKADINRLLKKQLKQSDNRLSIDQIKYIENVLNLDDKTISTLTIAENKIKTLKSDEIIGPVLINEIHESRQPFSLIKQGEEIVGYISFKDLNINSSGTIKDHMHKPVYFIHENSTIAEALGELAETEKPMLVVTDVSEDILGILTLKDLITELIGETKNLDLDIYSDKSKVASYESETLQVEEPSAVNTEVEVIE